jgi:AGZA family xanthine/uracil permease-like MFS transporter
MLWGGFLAELIDRRLGRSVIYLLIMAALTFVGVIHSALPDGVMYLPWALPTGARAIPYQFAVAYAVLAGTLLLLSFTKGSKEKREDRH